jgi:pilus assembly protein Flp/PilA
MRARIRQLWNDRSGATAIEYALMAALFAIAAIAGAQAVGVQATGMFDDQAEAMQTATEGKF